jgi:hypothetical protein
VALLMVISSIMLLSVIVTEMSYSATVRVSLAQHHRDEAKAEVLASTGVQLYRLILMASKQIGKNPMIQQFGQMVGLNGDSVWQLLPGINTGLMRMIFVSDGDLDEDDKAAFVQGGVSEEARDESREEQSALRRNFLDFDGDFSASVKDETRYIFVGSLQAATFGDLLELPAAVQLQGLMNRETHKQFFYDNNIEKLELISNLVDWTDPDNTRLYQGGAEDSLYQRLEQPYLPKNAPFDTRDEIRLVDGWHLDGVWERFGRHLTIYGDGKVNVNTAHQPIMRALLTAYADGFYGEQQIDLWLEELMRRRGAPLAEMGVHFSSGTHFRTFCQEQIGIPLKEEVEAAVTTEATVFRIVSEGQVGDARVEILTMMDFTKDPTGKVLYWRIR